MAATRQDLFDFLATLGIKTTTHDHEAVFTVDESHKIKQDLPGGHSKNLFLKDKKGNLILVVCINDTDVDLKSFHKKYDCGRVSFGNADLLFEHLGVTPGSVTPFGLINDRDKGAVQLVLDANLMTHDLLNFHPLENTATTAIAKDDLLAFFKATGHEPTILRLEKEEEAS
ncbi:Ala-tRNA(Pro) hydrolase [Cohaesibacter sp. ES.047]|uniref:prolyl-tRNA synthetase associated domain-containing protein n=1 Tax=Cohaesibacter sp. ES.047 TaxID=1798205 RepID=UPI000BB9AA92|nr:prolyl-tRNA synthetase associated domain-containing protein [Cohaesibacter sp. ES.047]SNY90587.1 Ala-tRNA(Pro) hydrolase [Cohaesibacter sp. ES.047]